MPPGNWRRVPSTDSQALVAMVGLGRESGSRRQLLSKPVTSWHRRRWDSRLRNCRQQRRHREVHRKRRLGPLTIGDHHCDKAEEMATCRASRRLVWREDSLESCHGSSSSKCCSFALLLTLQSDSLGLGLHSLELELRLSLTCCKRIELFAGLCCALVALRY